MSSTDKPRIITGVTALGDARVHLVWSDGTTADVDLTPALKAKAFAPLCDAKIFATVQVGDWGHSLEWKGGIEMGADALWLETLSATSRDDVRQFLEWRLHNGLSLAKAAEALGISRRSVAYYSNGERMIPRSILLACKGWEVSPELRRAA